mmetsp:Transcript_22700/g.60513  ORF Transcript_22700/g.60513 Transcript_22700/m.60513 type:complete len:105 (+) Transcript_22700:704-1018(+)
MARLHMAARSSLDHGSGEGGAEPPDDEDGRRSLEEQLARRPPSKLWCRGLGSGGASMGSTPLSTSLSLPQWMSSSASVAIREEGRNACASVPAHSRGPSRSEKK